MHSICTLTNLSCRTPLPSPLSCRDMGKSNINRPVSSTIQTETMIRDLKAEIEALKQQMSNATSEETQKKLDELESSQKSAWEEREKLSLALEEERKLNMQTAMSNMLSDVKEQKVVRRLRSFLFVLLSCVLPPWFSTSKAKMKAIKKLMLEKESLGKSQKQIAAERSNLKVGQDELLDAYQALQEQYDKLVSE